MGALHVARRAEIHENGSSLLCKQYISRFDVPVADAFFMKVIQNLEDVHQQPFNLAPNNSFRQAAAVLPGNPEEAPEHNPWKNKPCRCTQKRKEPGQYLGESSLARMRASFKKLEMGPLEILGRHAHYWEPRAP